MGNFHAKGLVYFINEDMMPRDDFYFHIVEAYNLYIDGNTSIISSLQHSSSKPLPKTISIARKTKFGLLPLQTYELVDNQGYIRREYTGEFSRLSTKNTLITVNEAFNELNERFLRGGGRTQSRRPRRHVKY